MQSTLVAKVRPVEHSSVRTLTLLLFVFSGASALIKASFFVL